jgi:hypothetical protein
MRRRRPYALRPNQRHTPVERHGNMAKEKPFLGTWILDVEESDFEQGDPPRSATLRIEDDFGVLTFTMNTVSANGEVTNDSFTAMPDGPPIRLGKSGLADSMRLGFATERNLVSEAQRDGVTLMKAERELSEDGRTLTVTQTVLLPGAVTSRNISVYRRSQ